MNPTVGQIEWDARISTKRLKSDAREAEKIVESSGEKMSKSSDSIGNRVGSAMGTIAKRAALAFSVAGVAASAFALKSATDFEQTRIGIENMLGSADKAKDLLKDISDFAAKTPFEFPELAQATRQLLAFGFNARDAFKTMKQLGDVSAAVGAPIGDLAYLMGTLRTQGRAFTIDIRQFAQRGIPIYEYLAKVLKTNEKEITKMIEAGKIGFPQVQKAFAAMTAEGGKFHGSMAAQSKSLAGLLSTLKDNLGFVGRELIGINREGTVVAGSVFDRLRTAIGAFIPKLEAALPTIIKYGNAAFNAIIRFSGAVVKVAQNVGEYLAPKIKALVNSIGDLRRPLSNLITTYLAPMAQLIGRSLVFSIGVAIDAFNALARVLGPVTNWLVTNRNSVIAVALAFGSLAAALKIWDIVDRLRLAFAILQLQTIPSLIASFRTMAFTLTGPVGLAITGLALAVGFVAFQMMQSKSAADRLKEAQNQLKVSTDQLKTSQDNLKQSSLNLETATLAVERATRTYNVAVRQYGKNSLEAREASNQLKQAQMGLKRAQDDTKKATNELKAAETGWAKNSALVKAAEAKTKAINGLYNSLNRPLPNADSFKKNPTQIKDKGKTQLKSNVNDLFRADGGPVRAGSPYIVGEEGQELFVPRQSGTIIPNGAFDEVNTGQQQTVNVTLNLKGIMARSRADLRDVARDLISSINEELNAKGQPVIGGGAI